MRIGNYEIAPESPTFVVAEISGNHQKNFDLAVATVRAAIDAGADAVKLQTFTPESLTVDCDEPHFRISHQNPWHGKTLHALYEETAMPWEWQRDLMRIARDAGRECFSSPFDRAAVDFLQELEVPAYKIASCEITDTPFIEYVASKGKPVILSTGIATLSEVADAVAACERANNRQIVILKCAATYPAHFEEMNLRTIPDLHVRFGTVIGLSDHTPGISLPLAAVTLGAKVIEKHFTLSRSLGGADGFFSLEPAEFSQMIRGIREIESALGSIDYTLSERMSETRKFARSLFVVRDIRAGDRLTTENIRSIRPGLGLPPGVLGEVLGSRARRDLKKGTPLQWDLIE